MAILVTGGAGYIGSHVAKCLHEAGFEVVVADNLSRGHRWAVQWGPLERVDLLDEVGLAGVFRRHEIEAVAHLAGLAYVGESMQAPSRYFRNNVEGSLNLLRVMQIRGVNHIVFSSSCATYGTPEALPVRESEATRPVNPYGESKLMVERALHWFSVCHGLRYVTLRYFNAAGADPDGELGELHHPETHLIPSAIEAVLGRRPRLQIFGGDFDTVDGTCLRDFVHVRDLARAHVLALRHLLAGGEPLAVNLGSGEGRTVRQVLAVVSAFAGRTVPFEFGPRRPGDPAALVADASLAGRKLGWRAEESSLAEIAGSAWIWHSERLTRLLRAAG